MEWYIIDEAKCHVQSDVALELGGFIKREGKETGVHCFFLDGVWDCVLGHFSAS